MYTTMMRINLKSRWLIKMAKFSMKPIWKRWKIRLRPRIRCFSSFIMHRLQLTKYPTKGKPNNYSTLSQRALQRDLVQTEDRIMQIMLQKWKTSGLKLGCICMQLRQKTVRLHCSKETNVTLKNSTSSKVNLQNSNKIAKDSGPKTITV